MSTLYLVSAPIGNMGDITLRAISILAEVEVITCEDTRKTGLLLQNLKISSKPRLISFYEENETRKIPLIIGLLKSGKKVALVSNAGTPAICDPGFKLVRECLSCGIEVVPLPGPCAAIAAITSSGLPTDKFLFVGFLPPKEGKRLNYLKNLLQISRILKVTYIVYLSPHRLLKELRAIMSVFGNIDIDLSCELTKFHEKHRREKINQTVDFFEKNQPRGEYTVVFRAS